MKSDNEQMDWLMRQKNRWEAERQRLRELPIPDDLHEKDTLSIIKRKVTAKLKDIDGMIAIQAGVQ